MAARLSDHLLSRCTCKCWKIKWLYLTHFLWDGILEWAQGTATGTVSWKSLPKKKREAVHCTSCCCWSVSMYVCVSVCVFPLSWLKAKLLGRKPRTLARGSLFHILLCMGTPPSPRLSPCNSLWLLTRSFCQEVVLCCQNEMWLMWNHFIGREQMFYRPLRRRVPFPSLWTLFCFPRAFSLFLP